MRSRSSSSVARAGSAVSRERSRGRRHVEIAHVDIPRIAVHHDQRIRVGQRTDRGSTTQAHRRTGTQVTRNRHDIQTGDTTLQGFVDGVHTQTFKLLGRNGLRGKRDFAFRDSQTATVQSALGHHRHFFQIGFRLQRNLIFLAVNRQGLRLAAYVAETDFVFRITDGHREVTIDVGHRCLDDTPGAVDLADRGSRQFSKFVDHRTMHGSNLGRSTKGYDGEQRQ